MKIGVLGGSFNPIHIAHLRNAQSVLEILALDKIIILPSGTPPYDTTKTLVSAIHRVAMVSLAIETNRQFELDMTEVMAGGKQYTFNTIQQLKQKYPNAQFYFIVGGDMVDTLHTWYRIDELVKDVTFVGITRKGAKMATPIPYIQLDLPLLEISSSAIRDMIKQQKSIQYLVPDKVREYIKKEGLYAE